MIAILSVSVFVLGLLVGSFLNVVILRYNTGHSISHGRSECLSCATLLKWYELFPIVSFIVLRGRCRTCKVNLRIQYPLTEIATGILFYVIATNIFALPITIATAVIISVFYAIIVSILVVIFVYDLYHKIIPNGLVYAFIFLSFAQLFFSLSGTGLTFAIPNLISLLAGPAIFLPFFLLWFVSRGTWMGFGDAKLAIGIGWMLGVSLGFSAIILAFWVGAAVSLVLLAVQRLFGNRTLTFKSEIPFAPFLIIGFLVVLLCRWDVLTIGGFLATYFI
ncbi:hypothetical protein COB55_01455 [Candidatus Wolfebacteria bacterium]|nr:MAG: hypothetical protein COB55_01455 [Candidatus Wolfebacteria bacterium]